MCSAKNIVHNPSSGGAELESMSSFADDTEFLVGVTGLNDSRTQLPTMSDEAVIGVSALFIAIGFVGLAGNLLVVLTVLTDSKMRRSATNLFILNLATSDLFLMLFGVPEIVQVILNKGWLLGDACCKVNRYLLVVLLYASIMSLVAVCVERYIAIVHPMKAHIMCSRRRVLAVIAGIWPLAFACGLPTALFNKVVTVPIGQSMNQLCLLRFPARFKDLQIAFKYSEFVLFYLIPITVQVYLYMIICRRLFVGQENLCRQQACRYNVAKKKWSEPDAIRARKGVVKMLIACVVIYIVSYTPIQVRLFYNTFSPTPFKMNFTLVVVFMSMGYINSAANPVLYCIFSQNFRRRYIKTLQCWSPEQNSGTKFQVDPNSQRALSRAATVRCSTDPSNVSEDAPWV